MIIERKKKQLNKLKISVYFLIFNKMRNIFLIYYFLEN